MRAILLTFLVMLGCLISLVRPQIGVLFYIGFSLFRPDIFAWVPDSRLSVALAIATLIGSLRFLGAAVSCLRSPLVLAILVLLGVTFLSAATAVRPELSYPMFDLYLRAVAMALLIPVLVQTVAEMRWCVLIMALSLGLLGAKFGLFGLLRGGMAFKSGYGGFMSENNTLALALVMAMPLCWYSLGLLRQRWARAGVVAVLFLMLAAIVMMHSRGGILSLGVAALVLAFRSRHKLLTVGVIAVLTIPSIWLVRQSFLARMETLTATGEERDDSTRGRLTYWSAALRMSRDYPLFGVGFGSLNEQQLLPRYLVGTEFEGRTQVLHNTYLQMLVDSGPFAAALYVSMLVGTIVWLGFSVRRMRRERPGLECYPAAIQTSLIAFLVGATFLSQVRFDLLYMLLMAAAAWQRIALELPKPGIESVAGQPAAAISRFTRAGQERRTENRGAASGIRCQ